MQTLSSWLFFNCLLHLSFFTPKTFANEWKYNCFNMTSEVFPVEKSNTVYGQATFKMKGKRYGEIMANMPSYLQKIAETQAKVAAMVSDDEAQVEKDYSALRQQFQSRDHDDSYIPDPNKDFEEKMLLIQYADILGINLVGKTFKFLFDFGPLDFLDLDYTVYNKFIGSAAQFYYLHDNRLRKKKIVSMTHDYCADLAASLTQDPGWNSGNARNAYDLVFRCYDTFPFRQDAAEKVYDLVVFMTDFYVFTNFTSEKGIPPGGDILFVPDLEPTVSGGADDFYILKTTFGDCLKNVLEAGKFSNRQQFYVTDIPVHCEVHINMQEEDGSDNWLDVYYNISKERKN